MEAGTGTVPPPLSGTATRQGATSASGAEAICPLNREWEQGSQGNRRRYHLLATADIVGRRAVVSTRTTSRGRRLRSGRPKPSLFGLLSKITITANRWHNNTIVHALMRQIFKLTKRLGQLL